MWGDYSAISDSRLVILCAVGVLLNSHSADEVEAQEEQQMKKKNKMHKIRWTSGNFTG